MTKYEHVKVLTADKKVGPYGMIKKRKSI